MCRPSLKTVCTSFGLEYYLGRSETPVLDDGGNPVFYTDGAMAGRPKYKIKHNRKRENLNLYIWLHPRSQQERKWNRNTLSLAEKKDSSENRSFWRILIARTQKKSRYFTFM